MSKTAIPARGIMSTGSWDYADSYRIACDCTDNRHDIDVWIEVEPDNEIRAITLLLYCELETPWWEQGFNRLQEAWRVLTQGHSKFQGSLVMNQETAENFLNALERSLQRLKK